MITLKTLEEATAQEVFDQVATHLLQQKKRSKEGKDCLYRSPKGLKCAAGALISDEEADKLDAGGDFWRSLDWESLVQNGVAPEKHQKLIHDLQRVHDHQNLKDWPRALKEVADLHRLKFVGFLVASLF
jgi:hypothetical protein